MAAYPQRQKDCGSRTSNLGSIVRQSRQPLRRLGRLPQRLAALAVGQWLCAVANFHVLAASCNSKAAAEHPQDQRVPKQCKAIPIIFLTCRLDTDENAPSNIETSQAAGQIWQWVPQEPPSTWRNFVWYLGILKLTRGCKTRLHQLDCRHRSKAHFGKGYKHNIFINITQIACSSC